MRKKGSYVIGKDSVCACMYQIYFDWRNGVAPASSYRKCIRMFGSDIYMLALSFWHTSLKLIYFGGVGIG